MPHKKSTIKRLRQDEKRNARNKAMRSSVSTAIKKADKAEDAEREGRVREAVSAIDKAVKAGSMNKRTAARRKSSLMKAKPDSK